MLATKYNELDVTTQQWRVLHRIGARDIYGIRRAMRRYQVDNINDLVAYLEHHQPQADTRQRLKTALGRIAGGYERDPHAKDIYIAFRRNYNDIQRQIIQDRIDRIKNYDG